MCNRSFLTIPFFPPPCEHVKIPGGYKQEVDSESKSDKFAISPDVGEKL